MSQTTSTTNTVHPDSPEPTPDIVERLRDGLEAFRYVSSRPDVGMRDLPPHVRKALLPWVLTFDQCERLGEEMAAARLRTEAATPEPETKEMPLPPMCGGDCTLIADHPGPCHAPIVAPEPEPTTILRDPDLYCAQLTDPTAECYPDGHVPWYPTREEAEGEVDRLLKDGHKDWEEDVKVGLGDYDKPKREDYEVEPLWMGNPLKCAEPEPQERIEGAILLAEATAVRGHTINFWPYEDGSLNPLKRPAVLTFPTTEEPTP